jgi:hypothetical protein
MRIGVFIGIVATVQRGYFKSNNATCARTGTVWLPW